MSNSQTTCCVSCPSFKWSNINLPGLGGYCSNVPGSIISYSEAIKPRKCISQPSKKLENFGIGSRPFPS